MTLIKNWLADTRKNYAIIGICLLAAGIIYEEFWLSLIHYAVAALMIFLSMVDGPHIREEGAACEKGFWKFWSR